MTKIDSYGRRGVTS